MEYYFRDLGVEIDFIPVHLKQLVEPSPTTGELPKLGPRKKDNYLKDLFHWAELCGVTISPEVAKLRKTDAQPALRAAMAAQEMGRFREFHFSAYRARWCDARDLSQRDVLAQLLEDAGLDAQAALSRAESDELGARLDGQTEEAIERGVFGVPTVFVGEEMFWGNDRFELIRFYIERAQRAHREQGASVTGPAST